MMRWPYEVPSITSEEIQLYCVQDPAWQLFRNRLIGLPTHRKLVALHGWREQHLTHTSAEEQRRMEVQIANYINALKRGGQLNLDLQVIK